MLRRIRTIVLMLLAVAMLAGLTGCNTLRGAGEDVRQAGRAINDTFRK